MNKGLGISRINTGCSFSPLVFKYHLGLNFSGMNKSAKRSHRLVRFYPAGRWDLFFCGFLFSPGFSSVPFLLNGLNRERIQ